MEGVPDMMNRLSTFEDRVFAEGIRRDCLGKVEKVSLREGKLFGSRFGHHMGRVIESSEVFAVDYYGYVKKTRGFFKMVEGIASSTKGQVKCLEVPVIHFAALRVEKIAKLAPDLVAEFPGLKKEILDARGFKHKYEI